LRKTFEAKREDPAQRKMWEGGGCRKWVVVREGRGRGGKDVREDWKDRNECLVTGVLKGKKIELTPKMGKNSECFLESAVKERCKQKSRSTGQGVSYRGKQPGGNEMVPRVGGKGPKDKVKVGWGCLGVEKRETAGGEIRGGVREKTANF